MHRFWPDADGKFVREIAKGLYAWSFAHTVRIDSDDSAAEKPGI
jgi:hypothetical protein